MLHPEFVDGKYAFYTRPMDDFIETGSGGGIGFGLCDDITHAVIDEERMTSLRKYHTITEAKTVRELPPSRQTEVGYISHMEFVIPQPVYVTSFMLLPRT